MVPTVVILGAGAPFEGDKPTLTRNVNGDSVLNWLIQKFAKKAKIITVLGYESGSIAEEFDDLVFILNQNWKTSGSVGSLFSVDLSNVEDLIVCYGDILVRDKLVEQIFSIDEPVLVAYDSRFSPAGGRVNHTSKQNPETLIHDGDTAVRLGRNLPLNSSNGEFIGLVRFNKDAVKIIRDLQANFDDRYKSLFLSELVELIRLEGVPITVLDAAGEWVEVSGENSLAEFVLGTKAETLGRMKSVLKKSSILDQISFTLDRWRRSKDQVISEINNTLEGSLFVVRSSARTEDGFDASNAGAYESKLNVEREQLEVAIDSVSASYGNASSIDQVLVQPMLRPVAMSGVIFTRTLETLSPWFVVNYDTDGSTDGVTSGMSQSSKTFFHFRYNNPDLVKDAKMRALIDAVIEIEECISYDRLDIEFAVTSDGTVYIFQIRPIAIKESAQDWTDTAFIEFIREAKKTWSNKLSPNRQVVGKHTVYGVMPDWNPAEIIGANPNKLANTLYKMVITDHVWARQRAEFGYRDVRPTHLLVNFCGKPYVDVRASINSFIPASLNEKLATRLVDFYMETLKEHPENHDKLEFAILPTCLGPNFSEWRNRLLKGNRFNENEISQIEQSLRLITNNAIRRSEHNDDDLLMFTKECDALIHRNDKAGNFLAQAQMLLNFCETKGTLFFAHQARNAFVAITFLKEAVSAGILSKAAMEEFLKTIRTVSHELNHDACSVRLETLTWDAFVAKYGHLRPGTYDILSLAYKDDAESFLRPIISISEEEEYTENASNLWSKEKEKFFCYLNNIGIQGTPNALENYIRSSIQGREKSKFEFSRCLSAALDLLVMWGEINGFSRSDLSNISIGDILSMSEQVGEPTKNLVKQIVEFNQKERDLMLRCELPPLLTSIDDIMSFMLTAGTPNFIGSKTIRARRVLLGLDAPSLDLAGSIVVIEQADPGFDWIFSKGIAGLITLYGGANSHMAIRSAEFGITAAIGVGVNLYNRVKKSKNIELDPINKLVKTLS